MSYVNNIKMFENLVAKVIASNVRWFGNIFEVVEAAIWIVYDGC